MADKTEIAWCDSTFNPWIGCTKVGPGCDHCYAEADFDKRKHRTKWGSGQPRSRTSAQYWKQPIRWNANPFYECPGCGWRGDDPTKRPRCPTCDLTHMLKPARRRVFCASLGDVFDNEVPADWRRDLFALIELTQNLDWLLLTKRIGNVQRLVREVRPQDWLAGRRNVWIGATVCNQEEAGRDIPKLLMVPAQVRFLSMEPLLGAVDLSRWLDDGSNEMALAGVLDWVVVGGESSPHARPMHPDWARGLRDQCAAAGVPFMFKQFGEWAPRRPGPTRYGLDGATSLPALNMWPCGYIARDGAEFRSRTVSTDNAPWQAMWRIGKKAAGRLLDGVLHDAYPEVRP